MKNKSLLSFASIGGALLLMWCLAPVSAQIHGIEVPPPIPHQPITTIPYAPIFIPNVPSINFTPPLETPEPPHFHPHAEPSPTISPIRNQN